MNFESDPDAESLFQTARETLGENGFDDSKALIASEQGSNSKERLLLYLKALESMPLVADQHALTLVKLLALSTENDAVDTFGIDVEFNFSDKLMADKTVPLELLRDMFLRAELANLIDRLERLPDL